MRRPRSVETFERFGSRTGSSTAAVRRGNRPDLQTPRPRLQELGRART